MWEYAAAMAALGLLQGAQQQRIADKQRQLQAATAQYSPWTGLTPQPVNEPNAWAPILQGGIQGYAMGQQAQSLEYQKSLADAALVKAKEEARLAGAAADRLSGVSAESVPTWAQMPKQSSSMQKLFPGSFGGSSTDLRNIGGAVNVPSTLSTQKSLYNLPPDIQDLLGKFSNQGY